jgi:predicted HTH transcriptional regulator
MESYPRKESTTLEFKVEVPAKKQTLLKTVVAFANTYGGQIIVGVDDDQNIVGVDEVEVDELIADLTRSIYDAITPGIFPSIFTKRIAEALVVVIEISEGMNKPYFFAAKTLADSCYVRLSAQTMLATPDIIQQLQWQGQRRFLDEMPVYSASKKDINQQAFKEFLNNRTQKLPNTSLNTMLYHYGVLRKENGREYPSTGGLLLFGKQPEKFFSEAFVICTHFAGTSGREVVATRDSVGSLFQQYKDTVAFISSRLNKSFKIEGTGPRIA